MYRPGVGVHRHVLDPSRVFVLTSNPSLIVFRGRGVLNLQEYRVTSALARARERILESKAKIFLSAFSSFSHVPVVIVDPKELSRLSIVQDANARLNCTIKFHVGVSAVEFNRAGNTGGSCSLPRFDSSIA